MLNKIKAIIKNVIKKITIIKDKIISFDYKLFFQSNKYLIIFMITNLINSSLLRFFTVKNYFEFSPIFADFTILLLFGSFSFLLKQKNRNAYYLLFSFFFTLMCVLNSIYYGFYTSFTSFSLLATSVQVADVGDAVIQNVLQIKDFTYVWQPLFIFFMFRTLSKKDKQSKKEEIEIRKNQIRRFLTGLSTSVLLAIIFILTLTTTDMSRITKQWNREYLVAKFGLFTYQLNDLIKSLEPKINTLFGYDKALRNFYEFYENKIEEPKINKYTNIFKGKNIIMIHAESIQTIAMNTSFNGLEVTPHLNKLASEGMFFSNFYSQVSIGTSSDAEFTLNTSLMPSTNGTVFISYSDRDFISIPKLLKEQNYYSFSMHGNNGSFWNRLTMHNKLGYDTMIHQKDYEMDEVIGLGLSDKSFFRQSVPIIKEIQEREKKPFYTTVITLSNHTPFDELDSYGEFPVDYKYEVEGEIISAPYMENTLLGNYFKSVRYADEALQEFIDGLDEKGLLDNTVIVIYGDHDARLPRKNYNRLFNYDPYTQTLKDKEDPDYVTFDYYQYELNRKVPFIIWTKEKKFNLEVDEVMGMYDIMPTLGNMFGFNNPYALGHDIFSVDENIVIFPNGNFVTKKVYYSSQKEEYILLDDEPIESDYIEKRVKATEEMIDISNDIIVHDLLKKVLEEGYNEE